MARLGMPPLLASAVAYLWVSSYQLGLGLTPSALLAGLAAYLATLCFLARKGASFDPRFRSLLVVSLCLLVWAAFVYAISGLGLPRRLMQIALGIGVAFSVYMIADSFHRVQLLVGAMISGAVVSSLVGVGQFFLGQPFISLSLAFGEVSEDVVRAMLGGRIAGLASSQVSLGYHLVTLVPIGVALWCGSRVRGSKLTRVVLLGAIAAMTLALLLTQVRSAVGGAFLGSAFSFFLMRGRAPRWRGPLMAALGVCAVLYVGVGWFYLPARFVEMADLSARSRLPMQLAGITYALHHPFGTGDYALSEKYISQDLDPMLAESVLSNTTHNQFLNVLVYYGFPGLGLLLAFYWLVLRETHELWKMVVHAELARFKWLPAGIGGALVGYLVNSMFHNAGPFVGDIFHWYLIGLVFAAKRVLAYAIPPNAVSHVTERKVGDKLKAYG